MTYTIRAAREEDVRSVFLISTDPEVRAASLSPDPIPWDVHTRWFGEKLADPQHLFFVAVDESGGVFGQVRYQLRGDTASVAISIDARNRGRGMGRPILRECDQRAFAARADLRTIQATIRAENLASRRMFAGCGYVHVCDRVVNPGSIHVLIYERQREA